MLAALDIATRWNALGVSTVPIQPGTKKPLIKWLPYQLRLPSLAELTKWFTDNRNMALIGGTGSLVCLDFDDVERFADWASWATKAGGVATDIACNSYKVRTSRGVHIYLRAENTRSYNTPWCEVRGYGRYFIAPPSLHPTGAEYKAIDPQAPILQIASTDALFPEYADTISPSVIVKTSRAETTGPGIIAAIKDRHKLGAYVRSYVKGLQATDRGAGRWYMGLCPFHPDRDPSFRYDASRETWGCFSPRCPGHRGGDVIDFYALLKGVDNRTAMRELSYGL